MRLLILALCIASAVAFGNFCKSGDDCEPNECCVTYIAGIWNRGVCRNLRNKDESCIVGGKVVDNDGDGVPEMYHTLCPCKEGLECRRTEEDYIFGIKIKHRAKCFDPSEDKPETD